MEKIDWKRLLPVGGLRRCAVFAAVLACLGAGASMPENLPTPLVVQDLSIQVIWLDEAKRYPLFVPETLLQRTAVTDLNLVPEAQNVLVGIIEFESTSERPPHPSGTWPRCSGPSFDEVAGSAADAAPLSVAALERISFLGTVEQVVQGYRFLPPGVARVGYVRVEEILNDPAGTLAGKLGALLAVADLGGEIEFGGIRTCTRIPKGRLEFATGDRLLVIGTRWGSAPDYYFNMAFFFPVEDGLVTYQPYSQVLPGCTDCLDSIRRAKQRFDWEVAP